MPKGKIKVKLNMNNGNSDEPAWDYLRDDSDQWIEMNAYKKSMLIIILIMQTIYWHLLNIIHMD